MDTKQVELHWEGCQPGRLDYQYVSFWRETKTIQEAKEIVACFPKFCGFKITKFDEHYLVSAHADLTPKGENKTNEAGIKRLRRITKGSQLTRKWRTLRKEPINAMSEDYFKSLLS